MANNKAKKKAAKKVEKAVRKAVKKGLTQNAVEKAVSQVWLALPPKSQLAKRLQLRMRERQKPPDLSKFGEVSDNAVSREPQFGPV